MAAIRHQANQPAPKKRTAAQPELVRSHPLVAPGNPAHSPASCAKAHRSRLRRRMVAPATRSPRRRPKNPTSNKHHNCNASGLNVVQRVGGSIGTALLAVVLNQQISRIVAVAQGGLGAVRGLAPSMQTKLNASAQPAVLSRTPMVVRNYHPGVWCSSLPAAWKEHSDIRRTLGAACTGVIVTHPSRRRRENPLHGGQWSWILTPTISARRQRLYSSARQPDRSAGT